MTDKKFDLLVYFDRPSEPCFMQKGEQKVVLDIPETYYPEKYKKLATNLSNRFGSDAERSIPVRNIALPNLDLPMKLGQKEQFSLFVPGHRTMAAKLIDIFVGMRDLEDLFSICAYCQLRINPYMFNYCLSVAILHRPDTKGLNIPTFVETFPDKFVDPKALRRAREISSVETPGDRMPVLIPVNYTANGNEPEQRVAYFREDIGINLHHWHWHLVYPFDSANRNIVNKDRRGELFYYMHQQIICRHTAERFCNGLGRVKRFQDFKAPIDEGYFPKMNSFVASRTWPPRFANTVIRDIDRPVDEIKSEVNDMENWRQRFLQAIENMAVDLPRGRKMPLDEETGIDVLGNLMESSVISRNRAFYGDMHNMGHVFISYSHDPDHRHLESFGVMGDSATAMRDPVFYRWHAYIDDIFSLYKHKLTPYGNDKLDYPGVRVSSISIESSAGPNTIGTLWQQNTVDLSRGLDFTPRGSVLASFTHLQHNEFNYVIEVNNTSGKGLMGTVRIFIAPIFDETGQALPFDQQRRLMIELDKFTQPLPAGNSTVRRKSVDSGVTIPFERTFRDQTQRPGDQGTQAAAEFDFCGCGWPQHMLVPKGTTQGYPMVLFVMISNWDDDKVEQDLVGACNDAASYCGIRDRKYPDKRAMGFPFDRATPSAATLSDFLRPNMAVRNCTIRHNDTAPQDSG
uniref:tyrosinase n=1 Tax=Antheraea pernyi TaxID=7119 RepID=A0A076FU33_ANTPE|nr:prophenoloxidase [Antheraea pernyi]